MAGEAAQGEILMPCESIVGGAGTGSLTAASPKTRSGKIMRRILRKIAENEVDSLGDTSTLADPSVADDLVDNRAANQA